MNQTEIRAIDRDQQKRGPARVRTFGIFLAAVVCEIAGGFAIWAWLKNDRPMWLAVPGAVALVAFAWILTRVDMAYAGRAYAAYGGI